MSQRFTDEDEFDPFECKKGSNINGGSMTHINFRYILLINFFTNYLIRNFEIEIQDIQIFI